MQPDADSFLQQFRQHYQAATLLAFLFPHLAPEPLSQQSVLDVLASSAQLSLLRTAGVWLSEPLSTTAVLDMLASVRVVSNGWKLWPSQPGEIALRRAMQECGLPCLKGQLVTCDHLADGMLTHSMMFEVLNDPMEACFVRLQEVDPESHKPVTTVQVSMGLQCVEGLGFGVWDPAEAASYVRMVLFPGSVPPPKAPPSYPEHEKLKAVSETSQAQGQFLEWLLSERGLTLAEWVNENQLMMAQYNIRDLLAEYHGIDQKVLEQEKEHMLEELRANAKK